MPGGHHQYVLLRAQHTMLPRLLVDLLGGRLSLTMRFPAVAACHSCVQLDQDLGLGLGLHLHLDMIWAWIWIRIWACICIRI